MTKVKIISDRYDVTDIVKSAISAEIKKLQIGLNRTNREIKQFEDEYKTSSDAFIKGFSAEDLKGGDEEYIRWAGELKLRDRILDELDKLKDIEYVAN